MMRMDGWAAIALGVAAGVGCIPGPAAAQNQPPVPDCRPYLTPPVDQACAWQLTSADLEADFDDPEGDALTCAASPSTGTGLGARAVTSSCQDSAGNPSTGTCQYVAYPQDTLPPVNVVGNPVYVVDAAQGPMPGWKKIETACQMTITDNCTSAASVARGIVGVTSSHPDEVIGGSAGAFNSGAMLTTWKDFWVDVSSPLGTRTYTFNYATLDGKNNWSYDDCVVEVVVDTCADGVMDGDETDVDCGGSCGPCELGEGCATSTDCAEGSCDQGVCACPEGTTGPGCADCAEGYLPDGQGGCELETCANTALSCGAHGSCDDGGGPPVCACEIGYTGAACDSCVEGFEDDGAGGCQAEAGRLVLMDFGASEATSWGGFWGWQTVLHHPQYTEFVDPDGDPAHAGITATSSAPDWQTAYMGVTGTPQIDFQKGQRIVATFYNNTPYTLRLMGRISFTDPDEPSGATWAAPWNTMYVENPDQDDFVPGYSTGQLVYNITDETNLAAPLALPTEGLHSLVNIALTQYNSWHGAFILNRIELMDDADFTPPEAIPQVDVSFVPMTAEANAFVPQLSWPAVDDVPGPHGEATGVSRYHVYRDGHFLATVSRDQAVYYGQTVVYKDLTTRPGIYHTYEVAAVDSAVTGYYPVMGETHTTGNEGPHGIAFVQVPSMVSTSLINPYQDMQFLGGFRLPPEWQGLNSSFAYAGMGVAYDPDGNPGADPEAFNPGSLFIVGHTQAPQIAEVEIPIPQLGYTTAELPLADFIQPFTADIYPHAYSGSWLPPGSNGITVGLGYHSGGGIVDPALYYSIFRDYSAADTKTHGSIALDLASSTGAWYAGAPTGQPGHVEAALVDRFIFEIPAAFASANGLGTKTLGVGQGYQSGVGVPTRGPALFAAAPWDTGSLPGDEGSMPVTTLLRYGDSADFSQWMTNWSLSMGFAGAAWLSAGDLQAVVVAVSRPVGEEWYGGEDGYLPLTSDWDLPWTSNASLRGPMATEREASLLFYNPEDLARVVAGTLEPWEPQPYLVFDFKDDLIAGDPREPRVGDIAYDDVNDILYFIHGNGDNSQGSASYDLRSMVYAWKVEGGIQGN